MLLRGDALYPSHLLRDKVPEGGARDLIVPPAVARPLLHQLGGALAVVPDHELSDLVDVPRHATRLGLPARGGIDVGQLKAGRQSV
jgi:hypothetical protein